MPLTRLGLGGILTFDEKPAVQGVGRARDAFGRFVKTTDEIPPKLTRLGRAMQSVSRSTKRLGKGMSLLGRGLSRMAIPAAALAVGFGASVKSAAKFETQMAKVNTLLGDQPELLNKLGKSVLDMSDEYGLATDTMTEGLFQAISAGVKLSETQGFMEIASKAAVGGFTDMGTAVDGLTTFANVWALKTAPEVLRVSDSIFIANKLGKTTFEELSRSVGRAAATAKGAGLSYDELLSTVVAVTKGGVVTAETMSGLKAALAGLARPTKDAEAEAKRLKIQFNTAAVQTMGWSKFLAELTKKTKGNKVIIDKLFGSVEAGNTILNLTSQEGFANFSESMEGMRKGAGATEEAFGKVAATTEFQWNRMSQSIANTLKTVGASFLSTFSGLFEGTAEFASGVRRAMMEIQQIDFSEVEDAQSRINKLTEKYGDTAVGVALGVNDVMVFLKETWEGFVQLIKDAGKWLNDTFGKEGVRSLVAVAGKIVAVMAVAAPFLILLKGILWTFGGIIPIVKGLGLVMKSAFGPIGLIVAGIIALVAMFSEEVEGVDKATGKATSKWKVFGEDATVVLGALNLLFLDLVREIHEAIKGVMLLLDVLGILERKPEIVPTFGEPALARPEFPALLEPKAVTPVAKKRTRAAEKTERAAAAQARIMAELARQRGEKPVIDISLETKVDLDGKQVGRSVARRQQEIQERAMTATPWTTQRRLSLEHGAIPAAAGTRSY